MTKMAAMLIYSKNLLKIFSRTRRPVTLGLGMLHCFLMHINGFFSKVVDFSAKVLHVLNILFRNSRPIELKFHMKSYDRLANIFTNCSGHMTKMATTRPYLVKKPLNIFVGTKRPMALGLYMDHWRCGPYQVFTNDYSVLTFTYLMACRI